MISIDYEKCCWKDGKAVDCNYDKTCQGCVEVCPAKALKREDILIFDPDKCISCNLVSKPVNVMQLKMLNNCILSYTNQNLRKGSNENI